MKRSSKQIAALKMLILSGPSVSSIKSCCASSWVLMLPTKTRMTFFSCSLKNVALIYDGPAGLY